MRFENKVVVVTGGAFNMGKLHAERYAGEGASVVVADINEEVAKKVAAELPRAIAVKIDVSSEADWQKLADAALQAFGRIDVMINNAGGPLMEPTAFDKMSETQWERVINVNLKSVWLSARAVVPAMKKQGKGKIVNIASRIMLDGSPVGMCAYAAAKGGVVSVTRALARELGPFNIAVNSVSPGGVGGDPGNKPFTPEEWQRMAERNIAAQIIRTRRVSGADVVAMVAFLASDEADLITGQHVNVNGGTFFY